MKWKIVFIFLLIVLLGSALLANYLNKPKQTEKQTEVKTNDQTDQASEDQDTEPSTSYEMVSYDTLFDNSKLHHFKLVISKEEWDGLSRDMLEIQSVDDRMRTGNYRTADLYYSDEKGEVKIDEIGIRTKGNTSRTIPETSEGFHRFNFKLKFNETFEMAEGSVEYEERDDRKFADLAELNFKANDGADPTNMRELFCYDLIDDFGVITSKASMATLTIVVDGIEHDYGVVKYIEPVDKDFLTKRFSKDLNDGNLYKCLWQDYGPATLMPIERARAIGIKDWTKNYRPAYDLKTNKKEPNYEDLIDFIENINQLNDIELKTYLEQNFEVDRFIRAQALDVVLGNIDGYRSMGNNYYMYFNENGKVEWIPYDYDNILGAGWYGDPLWSYEGIAQADIYQWNNLNATWYKEGTTHPLIDKILEIDEYKKTYVKYLGMLTDPSNDYFSYSRFMNLYNELYNLYGGSVGNEMNEGAEWKLSNEQWYFDTKIESINQQLSK